MASIISKAPEQIFSWSLQKETREPIPIEEKECSVERGPHIPTTAELARD
jgi:hypothetical protein